MSFHAQERRVRMRHLTWTGQIETAVTLMGRETVR